MSRVMAYKCILTGPRLCRFGLPLQHEKDCPCVGRRVRSGHLRIGGERTDACPSAERPFDNLRVAPSLVDGRQPARALHGARRPRRSSASPRRRARRCRVAEGRAHRRVHAAGTARGLARERAHGSAHHVRRPQPADRRPRIRCPGVGAGGHRDAPRLRPVARRGQLFADPRYLQRLAQRLHVRHDAARRQARAADFRGRRGQQPQRPRQLERQSQLGRHLGGGDARDRRRVDSRDRDPADDDPLFRRVGAVLGAQLHAEHPPQERAGVLGADSEGVYPDARQHGRRRWSGCSRSATVSISSSSRTW